MSLKPRTVTAVVLYDGDDQEELALLKRAADQAVAAAEVATQAAAEPNARAGGEDLDGLRAKAEAAKATFDAFVDVAAERAVEVRVQAIGRTPFRELMAAHPPRMVTSEPDEDGKTVQVVHEDDASYEVNTETFPMALLTWRDPDDDTVGTLMTPEFGSDEARQRFLDRNLNEGDFDQAWFVAYSINRNPSADPSRFRFSVDSQSSTETEK